MEKNNMYFNVQQTMIHKSVYRPSSNLTRFARVILSILLVGHSPIQYRNDYERRVK
jgi:hypothetical protein